MFVREAHKRVISAWCRKFTDEYTLIGHLILNNENLSTISMHTVDLVASCKAGYHGYLVFPDMEAYQIAVTP